MRGMNRKGGPESCWHVMNRGAQKMRLFDHDDDFESMLRLIRIYTSKHGLAVYAYCIMPNHYHVLMRGAGESLSKCFHEVDRMAARAHNERWKSKGHVFQGTFLSFRQRTLGWMVRTSLYIHMNPLGKRVRKPGGYRWSSYGAYASPDGGEDWVESRPVLRFFDSELAKARQDYRRCMNLRITEAKSLDDPSEEGRIRRSAARELSRAVPRLVDAFGIGEDEARRFAAHYGRTLLGLSVEMLAAELGFSSATNLSNHLCRVSERAANDASVRKLLDRSGNFLDALAP